MVFAVNRVDDADEVVAVIETRAGNRGVDIEDAVRRRVPRDRRPRHRPHRPHPAGHHPTHHQREGAPV
ncbi:MAG: hypothetical protein QM736_25145 [Vicinamibacterales bacterium]